MIWRECVFCTEMLDECWNVTEHERGKGENAEINENEGVTLWLGHGRRENESEKIHFKTRTDR